MTDKLIYISFSKPKSKLKVFSWFIRLFECTKYSHVYLSWTSSSGPTIAYEAAGSRVRFVNKKIFDEDNETLHSYSFNITKEQYRELIKFTMTNVGADYGFLQLIGIALVRIFNLKKNPFSDGRASQVCSETVAYFIEDILKHKVEFNKDIAGPKDIKNYLDTYKETTDGRNN